MNSNTLSMPLTAADKCSKTSSAYTSLVRLQEFRNAISAMENSFHEHDSSSCYESEKESLSNDLDELYPTTLSLGLSKDYVKNWGPIEAYGEFYQNWYDFASMKILALLFLCNSRKDPIIYSFHLDPRSFLPTWSETPT